MAFVITETCVACGACEATCPMEAISMGAEHFEINAEACVSCGACAGACPMEAIVEG